MQRVRRTAKQLAGGAAAELGFAGLSGYLQVRYVEQRGRSNECGPSFGSAATGWWQTWHDSGCGDGCQLARPAARARTCSGDGQVPTQQQQQQDAVSAIP